MRTGEQVFYRSFSGVVYRGEIAAENLGGSYDVAVNLGGKTPVMVRRVRPAQIWKVGDNETETDDGMRRGSEAGVSNATPGHHVDR